MDKSDGKNVPERLRRVPVTAMVVLATTAPNLPNANNASIVQQSAVNFLVSVQNEITDPFSIAITTYALMSTSRGTHSVLLAHLKRLLRDNGDLVSTTNHE